ncbi:hypothetical protein [Xanthocytophaga agilis]|uniref:MoxR-vWA-beta-propeller ternary system domain-containing protein n=1 Tax=Xanthocytophaga agilis TaxID=3048010 RepID=A0AAE3R4U9_9BACT|nr:hypothetical protein [Xanthocytophaga agilis]MDJ1501400.1 hypothetical protein [Xanthocytophaga agilis]
MILSLTYNEHSQYILGGAFVRGTTPEEWLTEINHWEIDPDQLVCFIIPESIRSVHPAGLFVVFRGNQSAKLPYIRNPYGALAEKLFIPIQSNLSPAITPEELRSLLVWDYQVFHPGIGFIGFEKTDQIDLTDLIAYSFPIEKEWNFAHTGVSTSPRLQRIGLQQMQLDELMQSFKESVQESVGSKPIQELAPSAQTPVSQTTSFLLKLLIGILGVIMGIIWAIVNAILSLFRKLSQADPNQPAKPSSTKTRSGSSGAGSSGGSGGGIGASISKLIGGIQNWASEKLEDLQKKRESELQRLLRMFDENMEEALKYAIPLDGNYQNRGMAPPSSTLSRRDTNFSLSGLGGGGPVDGWNVDNYYQDLRRKYQNAANKEIEAGDFKKAAYIYAHLLGDYHSAANTLKQGKHFREAAVLYKDHLRNTAAAAECLEEGGLFHEAIDLYVEMNRFEKAGDLYTVLEQKDKADQLYEQCLERSLQQKDYLDASRLALHKLESPQRTKQILLDGWQDSTQAETCLLQYTDLVAKTEKDQWGKHMEGIYQQTPSSKRNSLLNVLTQTYPQYKDQDSSDISKNIAFTIISEQASAGNTTSLNKLKTFVPNDQLLIPDTNRYIHQIRTQPVIPKPAPTVSTVQKDTLVSTFKLVSDISWIQAIAYQDQFLAFGIKQNILYIARISSEFDIEYIVWSTISSSPTYFNLIHDPAFSKYVILHTDYTLTQKQKVLSTSMHFRDEISVLHPSFLPNAIHGICFNESGEVVILHTVHSNEVLSTYSIDGTLLSTNNTHQTDQQPLALIQPVREMIYRKEMYHTADGESLIQLIPDRHLRIDLGSPIRKMTATNHHTAIRFIVSTEEGCVLIRHSMWKMQKSNEFFARGKDVQHLCYIPDNFVIVADSQIVEVYTITQDNPKCCHTFEVKQPIVSILPAAKRNHFVVVTKAGEMQVHKASAEDI